VQDDAVWGRHLALFPAEQNYLVKTRLPSVRSSVEPKIIVTVLWCLKLNDIILDSLKNCSDISYQ
jgi:hypothetical protein